MKKELDIRDEEILLLGLCRLDFTNAQTEKLRVLTDNIEDWAYFATLANDHGVVALVYHNLEKLGFLSGIPEAIVSSLKNSSLLSLSRNAFLLSSLTEILILFQDNDIKSVLLKGLALEQTVYGNKGLRQMTDIDILLDRSSYKKARKILVDSGYKSLAVKSVFHRPIIAYTGKHLPSLLKEGISVDLHLELFSAKRTELTKHLFDSSSEIKINDQSVHIPRPQFFFLYLIKHLYSHELQNESQLRLYADLAVLLDKYRDEIINYDVLTFALEAGLEGILAWKLELLRDLWGLAFPDWLDDYIDKWYNPESINRFVLFLKSPKNNSFTGKEAAYRKMFFEIPGFHRKILYLLGDLFPTLTFMKERYQCGNKLSALLNYPHRFGKILWLLKK